MNLCVKSDLPTRRRQFKNVLHYLTIRYIWKVKVNYKKIN